MSTPTTPAQPANVMEAIVSLAKRRGFVYQASEIYGGIRGFWDYGPLGVLLKNNIRDHWWRSMVECPPVGPDGNIVDMVGLDSSIIQHPKTWKASGHVDTFTDPMVDCLHCRERFRADHVHVFLFHKGDIDAVYGATRARLPRINELRSIVAALDQNLNAATAAFPLGATRADLESLRKQLGEELDSQWKEFCANALVKSGVGSSRADAESGLKISNRERSNYPVGPTDPEFLLRSGTERSPAWSTEPFRLLDVLPCPSCGKPKLTDPRPFNLMLFTYPGPITSDENKAYLRPETAQGIFLNFKNVVDTTRVKVPFGVAQIGKSFRNEVTPRNFIFRSREFEQMEMEFFCPPDEALKWYEFWRNQRMKWWYSLGINPENLKFRDHEKEELSHYSKATVDIEYKYPFTAPDFGELEGIAHRGDFDLTQHQTHSGAKLDYFDQDLQLRLKEQGVAPDDIKKRSRYIPNVIEPASGLTRAVLVLLCEAYRYDETRPSKEYFSFKPQFAPIKAGIFPLVNKDGMPEIAEKLYLDLRSKFTCEYDPKQSIGKRYARMDEIGTPFCVTIDGDTTSQQIVTIRNRDTQQQDKVNVTQVESYLREKLA